MSKREWKPGDVAMIEAGCWANRKVGLRLAEGWAHTNGVNVDGDGVVAALRPLVVIDPEDREQVERLLARYLTIYDGMDAVPSVGEIASLSTALREFANPTPPKPDEPLGLGAVVEDGQGVKYVRAGITHDGSMEDCWRHVTGNNIGYWSKYANIAVVRVLSEGVTP